MKTLLTALVLAAVALPAMAQSVTLKGPTGRTETLSAADVARLPRVRVTFGAAGETRRYEGPLLADLLARVEAPVGIGLRGPALAQAIVVKASDGYRVVLGLADADRGMRDNRVILADRVDGAPLGADRGPFMLVVEGDLRPARAVRTVTEVEVVDLSTR